MWHSLCRCLFSTVSLIFIHLYCFSVDPRYIDQLRVLTLIHPDLQVSKTPNPLIKLEREPEWAELHQPILGPDRSWFYLGPNNSPGYVCYGTNPIIYGMNDRFRKQKWAGCRYVI